MLTAVPLTGSVFIAWSGALNSTNNPETLIMDTNKTVTADLQRYRACPHLCVPTGNDSNAGTMEEPFYSLAKAASLPRCQAILFICGAALHDYTATTFLTKFGTRIQSDQYLRLSRRKGRLSWAGWTPANETERGGAPGQSNDQRAVLGTESD